jgi:hypothetical protein
MILSKFTYIWSKSYEKNVNTILYVVLYLSNCYNQLLPLPYTDTVTDSVHYLGY